MSPLLTAVALSLLAWQNPVSATEDSSYQLLVAAVEHMKAQRAESAAVLLRRVAETSHWPLADRVRAWVMLGVVDHVRYGDSAAAYALRQALALDPALAMPALERNYPEVARILEAERGMLARTAAAAPPPPAAAPPLAQQADSATPLLDCTNKCAQGGRAPSFIDFPDLQFADGSASVGVYDRRQRTFLMLRAVINVNGGVELETVQTMGGSARGMEQAIRGALAEARFAPGRLNGVPVRTRVTLRFDFEAEGMSAVRYTYKVTAR